MKFDLLTKEELLNLNNSLISEEQADYLDENPLIKDFIKKSEDFESGIHTFEVLLKDGDTFKIRVQSDEIFNKVTKSSLKKLLKIHGDLEVRLLPCKANMSSCWIYPTVLTLNLENLEKTVNEFEYYNCNNITGNYAHYYIHRRYL